MEAWWDRENCGVDTLRLSVGVSELPEPAPGDTYSGVVAVDNVRLEAGASHRRRLPGGGVAEWHSGTSPFLDGGLRVRLEASLPKLVTAEAGLEPSNKRPVRLSALPEAICGLVEAAERCGAVLGPVDGSEWLSRVDFVQDFDAGDRVGEIISGYEGVPTRGQCKQRLWRDPSRSGAQTLTKGNGARQGTLYDKHEECRRRGELGAEGQLRCELRMRRPVLSAGGIVGLDTLDRLPTVATEVWEWLGWRLRVVDWRTFVGLVNDRRDCHGVIEFLEFGLCGYVPNVSKNTRTKRLRQLWELGFVGAEAEAIAFAYAADHPAAGGPAEVRERALQLVQEVEGAPARMHKKGGIAEAPIMSVGSHFLRLDWTTGTVVVEAA